MAPVAQPLYILDSWPVLEWVQDRQPALAELDRLLELAMRDQVTLSMSRINFGEIVYSCWKQIPQQAAAYLADIETLPIDLLPVDDALVDAAALLKSTTAASYADCFAAALALRHGAPLVTGDRELRKIAGTIPLRLHWLGA